MGDQTGVTHPIKYVDDASKPASLQPVVVGPRNNADESYSALVAIFNTLLLRCNVNLPSFGDDSIGSDRMQELIGKSITVRRLCRRGMCFISFGFAFCHPSLWPMTDGYADATPHSIIPSKYLSDYHALFMSFPTTLRQATLHSREETICMMRTTSWSSLTHYLS